jgi:hypothetical protein
MLLSKYLPVQSPTILSVNAVESEILMLFRINHCCVQTRLQLGSGKESIGDVKFLALTTLNSAEYVICITLSITKWIIETINEIIHLKYNVNYERS